jgi:Ferritin-like
MNLPAHFTPVDSRKQLLGLLVEAAEIEQNLMCCYLYAAFNMRQDLDEGLPTDELGAVRRWRRTIIDVAIEEIGHLTMDANIMSSIGGTPQFGRQNLPTVAGYYPSGIVVKLAPFNANPLDHFIYLEPPDVADIPDRAMLEPPVQYERAHVLGLFMPG